MDARTETVDRGRAESNPPVHPFPEPTNDPAWLFICEGFDALREREVETWLTVANGRMGTRGALEEGSPHSAPLTLVAGAYGDGTGDPIVREPLPAADWYSLALRVDDGRLDIESGHIVVHRRILDMSQGIVFREWLHRDRWGRLVRLRTARFASLDDRAILALRAEARMAEPGPALLQWEILPKALMPEGAALEIDVLRMQDAAMLIRTWGRNGGSHALALATYPTPGTPFEQCAQRLPGGIGAHLAAGGPAGVDRLAAVAAAASHDSCGTAAKTALARARSRGFDELLHRHRAAWSDCWRQCDLRIDGDPEAQRAARFSVYHMVGSADPENGSVSVGARGLSGMSYLMHVFWDTEIFVVPFFIYSLPDTARTLLTYRYANLDGARAKARHLGYRGALFPWESADRGTETTPEHVIGPHGESIPILSGLMEHHISADIAWATTEYWRATGDDVFMADMGVEIMLETARFWASRTELGDDGRRHIRGVVGPDEYHENVSDNAFTNRMARWNVDHAQEALAWLRQTQPGRADALLTRMGVDDDELAEWTLVAAGLVDGFDPRTRLYEQFAGFFEMDDVDLSRLRPRPMSADLVLGREVTLRSKVVKQADVVMLCHLLADEIEPATARANYDYYEPITVHGSSLSPGISAAVAARQGRLDDALECFRMACAVDLSDNMGNASSGLHMATMGGIWQAVVVGFAGIWRHHEMLTLDPHLPADWTRVAFPLRFRGAVLQFEIGHDRATIDVRQGAVTLELGPGNEGATLALGPGTHTFTRGGDGAWKKGTS